MIQIPTVAIVGRPNVGKSTLFNKLTGARQAIEADLPGTTRDYLDSKVSWSGHAFRLIDTAGLFDLKKKTSQDLAQQVKDNIFEAIDEADLVLFVVDYLEKDNQLDQLIAGLLRRSKKPTLVVVNKCDNLSRIKDIEEFTRMGNWPTIGVSATLKKNLGDLLDQINLELKDKYKNNQEATETDRQRIAFVGRPNVGKSTLFNSFSEKRKMIVSNIPGTTRDAQSINFDQKGEKITITDTAGVLRSGKSGRGVEKFSLIRTLKAIDNCDLAVVILDATEGVTALDKKIAGYVADTGKSLILVFNKIDLVENQTDRGCLPSKAQAEFNYLPYVPLICISARLKENTQVIINQSIKVIKERSKTVSQEELNELRDLVQAGYGQLPRLKSIVQTGSNPPEFSISLRNKKDRWHFTFSRFLENRIRDNFDFIGTPIRISLKS